MVRCSTRIYSLGGLSASGVKGIVPRIDTSNIRPWTSCRQWHFGKNTHNSTFPHRVRSPPPLAHSCLSSSRGPRSGVCIRRWSSTLSTLSPLSSVCQRDPGSLRKHFLTNVPDVPDFSPARLLIGPLRVHPESIYQ